MMIVVQKTERVLLLNELRGKVVAHQSKMAASVVSLTSLQEERKVPKFELIFYLN